MAEYVNEMHTENMPEHASVDREWICEIYAIEVMIDILYSEIVPYF